MVKILQNFAANFRRIFVLLGPLMMDLTVIELPGASSLESWETHTIHLKTTDDICYMLCAFV
jgi:hypothetical protein